MATAVTGLDFPSNGTGGGTVQFRFEGANRPDIQPITLVWRVNLRQHAGYYTTFFHARGDGNFVGDNTYFGCHPYPKNPPGSSTHWWEVSINGNDIVNDANGYNPTVQYGRWYTQAATVRAASGGHSIVDFYYDLGAGADRRVSYLMYGGLVNSNINGCLVFGDAPWAPNNERLGGVLRGLQIYRTVLSEADIVAESVNDSVNTPVTSAGRAAVWYMNQNPTPADITDKSGAGHHPTWFNSNRPTLYSA